MSFSDSGRECKASCLRQHVILSGGEAGAGILRQASNADAVDAIFTDDGDVETSFTADLVAG
jgi:hypothetical protein